MPLALADIMKQIENAQKKANEANLARYQELLGTIDALGKQVGTEGTFGQAEQLLSQVGQAAQTRITQQAAKARSETSQDLISRGLGNTTIRQASMRGIRSDEEQARRAQEESTAAQKAGLLTQRAGLETQIGGMKAGAIEGRYDTGPDLGLYASLIQAAAAADKETTKGVTRTTTQLGANAQAGRTAAGTPFRYAGAPATGSGGGGSTGGIDQQTGRSTGLVMPTGSGGSISGGAGSTGTSRSGPEFDIGFLGGMGGGGLVAAGGAALPKSDQGTISMTPHLEQAAQEQKREMTESEKNIMQSLREQGITDVEFTGAELPSQPGGEQTWEDVVKKYNKLGIPIPDSLQRKFKKMRYAE